MRTFLSRICKVVMSEESENSIVCSHGIRAKHAHSLPFFFQHFQHISSPLLFFISVVINVRCLARSVFLSCIITFIVVDSLLLRSHDVQMNGFSDYSLFRFWFVNVSFISIVCLFVSAWCLLFCIYFSSKAETGGNIHRRIGQKSEHKNFTVPLSHADRAKIIQFATYRTRNYITRRIIYRKREYSVLQAQRLSFAWPLILQWVVGWTRTPDCVVDALDRGLNPRAGTVASLSLGPFWHRLSGRLFIISALPRSTYCNLAPSLER